MQVCEIETDYLGQGDNFEAEVRGVMEAFKDRGLAGMLKDDTVVPKKVITVN